VQIILANNRFGLGLSLRQTRNQHRRKDRYDHQQFDQGETRRFIAVSDRPERGQGAIAPV
jgi:hypothetical protein